MGTPYAAQSVRHVKKHRYSSSSFLGGGPHGLTILSIILNLLFYIGSFSATEIYYSLEKWPMLLALESLAMLV